MTKRSWQWNQEINWLSLLWLIYLWLLEPNQIRIYRTLIFTIINWSQLFVEMAFFFHPVLCDHGMTILLIATFVTLELAINEFQTILLHLVSSEKTCSLETLVQGNCISMKIILSSSLLPALYHAECISWGHLRCKTAQLNSFITSSHIKDLTGSKITITWSLFL